MRTSGGAIVVGVDQDGQSSAAVLWAAAEARRRDAVLRIVHAWQQAEGRLLPEQRSALAEERHALGTQEDVLDRVTAILERVAPDLVVTVEPVEGPPGPVLVDAASEAELLVVGTTARPEAEPEGTPEVTFGSVSRHCVAHARCEVVVVPDPRATQVLAE
jgi:nucleotide-binding universal stress UspA family protein